MAYYKDIGIEVNDIQKLKSDTANDSDAFVINDKKSGKQEEKIATEVVNNKDATKVVNIKDATKVVNIESATKVVNIESATKVVNNECASEKDKKILNNFLQVYAKMLNLTTKFLKSSVKLKGN